MSPEQLDAIRARAEAATEGPWETVPTVGNAVVAACDDGYWQDVADRIETEADAEFIAHARADIPALIGEVERLRSERDQAREECGHEKHMRKFVSDERDDFIAAKMRAEADRDRLAATLDRVRELAEEIATEGGYLTTGQVFADRIRAAIEGTDS